MGAFERKLGTERSAVVEQNSTTAFVFVSAPEIAAHWCAMLFPPEKHDSGTVKAVEISAAAVILKISER